ncbi:MAG: hypothetical protein ACKE5M_03285 [Methylophilaceae bacterium]
MTNKPHQFEPNWPAPDEYLLELGRMTTVWGTLEVGLDLAITQLAGYELTDERALILLAHTNFQQRIHMLGSLCDNLLPEAAHLVNYKNVLSKIEAAQKSRNKYAHNSIVTDDDTGDVNIYWYTSGL